MAPLDFKHFTSADYKPGEDDAVKYYAQKRKKQYHGNESKDIDELSMKKDQMQVFRVGHKDMSGNVHATDPDDAMRKLRKKRS